VKFLKWLGVLVVLLAVGAGIWYANRRDPFQMIAGRELSGEVATERIADWSFTDEHNLIAVETRPAAPHSVTTICMAYQGDLYIPAQNGSAKSWPHYAVSDPTARVKIDGRIYPVTLTRVNSAALTEPLMAAAREKYDFTPDPDAPPPEDIWVFKAVWRDPSSAVAAAAPSAAATPETPDVASQLPLVPMEPAELARAIVDAPDREQIDVELDKRRKPVELLTFAGVREGMRAADLGAGNGYTTELLARAAGPTGAVYGHNTPAVIENYVADTWPTRLAKPINRGIVRIDGPLDAPLPGAADLDMVTMIFVYHDTLFQDVDRPKMNAAIFAALKPGGSLVIVDNRAQVGAGPEAGQSVHRIAEALLRKEVTAAGFELAAEGTAT